MNRRNTPKIISEQPLKYEYVVSLLLKYNYFFDLVPQPNLATQNLVQLDLNLIPGRFYYIL
jgi:hypothetical protein